MLRPVSGPGAPERKIWIDGELVPWERAQVHVLSHSLQRGSLVFDYMSVHETPRGAAVFRLREHVERFLHSIELVGLPLRRAQDEIEAVILATVRANPGARAVKVSAYLPSIEVDVVPMDDRVSLAIAAYDPKADVIDRSPGRYVTRATIRLWIEKTLRNRRKDILPPQAKVAANYASPMAAKWAARRAGYDEIVLVDEDGCIAEAPTANLFWVDRAGGLRTPPAERVLLGVTRHSLLEIAKHDGIDVAEALIRPEELVRQAEVFLSGTTAGVLPVESVDGASIGDGKPGPVSLRLGARLREIQSGRDPAFEHWLVPAHPKAGG
jgi:branched-chain amino acid aminotransferase